MSNNSISFLMSEASRLRTLACEFDYEAADTRKRYPLSDDARRLNNRASAFRRMAGEAEAEAKRMGEAVAEALAAHALVFDPMTAPRGLNY